jgi:hypothetical protein
MPSQTVLQHTPPTQKPDPHSFATLQVPPFGLVGLHTPPMQNVFAVQSALVLQAVAQLVELAQL